MRKLIIDIETFPNLAWSFATRNAFLGPKNIVEPARMVSFAAKWHGERPVVFASEFHDGHEAMIGLAHSLLDEADVVIHYNGKRFDIPHINREVAVLELPPPSPYAQVDLYQVARRVFRFATNNLQEVARELDLGSKVEHEGFDLWLKCIAGEEKAWARFRRYNIGDVRLTERVYNRLLPWIANHPHHALYAVDPEAPRCQRCGGTKLHKRGFAYSPLGVFQQYQCQDCKSWSRGGKRLAGADLRGIQ